MEVNAKILWMKTTLAPQKNHFQKQLISMLMSALDENVKVDLNYSFDHFGLIRLLK